MKVYPANLGFLSGNSRIEESYLEIQGFAGFPAGNSAFSRKSNAGEPAWSSPLFETFLLQPYTMLLSTLTQLDSQIKKLILLNDGENMNSKLKRALE